MAIVSGDQNPALTVTGLFTGLFVGLNPAGVPMGVSVGIGVGASVMVNVVVATPVEPVAVTVYGPGDNSGTVIIAFALPPLFGIPVPTFIVPKVMLTEEASG
jgi:hypothetical protein